MAGFKLIICFVSLLRFSATIDLTDGMRKMPEYSPLRHKQTVNTIHTRTKRQAGPTYFIDVLPVVDFVLYEKWLDKYHGDEPSAQAGITAYLSDMFSSMNQFLATLNLNDGVVIVIKMVDPVIATESAFVESHKSDLGDGKFSVSLANVINDFKAWNFDDVANNNPTQRDLVMLFTGVDVLMTDDGPMPFYGVAVEGTVCSRDGYNIIIVQDNMANDNWLYAAHHFAHSLGAKHDGGTNECFFSDRFLLGEIHSPPTAENLMNPFQYSTCSVSRINQILAAKKADGWSLDNCLLPESGMTVADNPTNVYYMEDVCMSVYGDSSKLCPVDDYPSFAGPNRCPIVYCQDPKTGGCKHVVPPYGMCCGKSKYCVHGACVPVPNDGPCGAVDAECPYADITDCAETIGHDHLKCQDPHILNMCCRFCRDTPPSAPPPTTPPPPSCSKGWKMSAERDTCFKAVKKVKKTHAKAHEYCQQEGGKLATKVISKKQRRFVTRIVKNRTHYWLGVFRSAPDAEFQDMDGTPILSTSAFKKVGKENCVTLRKKRWYTKRCNKWQYFICQKDLS